MVPYFGCRVLRQFGLYQDVPVSSSLYESRRYYFDFAIDSVHPLVGEASCLWSQRVTRSLDQVSDGFGISDVYLDWIRLEVTHDDGLASNFPVYLDSFPRSSWSSYLVSQPSSHVLQMTHSQLRNSQMRGEKAREVWQVRTVTGE